MVNRLVKTPFVPKLLPHDEVRWVELIPLIGKANRALAKYDGVLYGVPNPEVLLSPLTTQEAVLSSKIEGTQATLGDVLKFDAGEEPSQESRRIDIYEINNYRRALREAQKELETRPFNLNLLLKLHSILLDSVRGRDKGRGKFRTIQNYIGAPNSALEDAAFVPPPANQLMTLLDNWEKYYHMDRPDPLVQLAVVHAQFEIIHPFLDGNGRLGRILLPLYLYEKKILRQPMFYLSAYLDKNRDSYIDHLRNLGVVEGSWNAWITFFLTALIEQAQQNADKASAVMDLYESLKTRVIKLTQSKFAVPLLDVLFERPVLRSTQLDAMPGMPSRAMINTLLNKLKSDGILKVIAQGAGQRAQILALAELLNLCEGKTIL
jgi:Fic family protein